MDQNYDITKDLSFMVIDWSELKDFAPGSILLDQNFQLVVKLEENVIGYFTPSHLQFESIYRVKCNFPVVESWIITSNLTEAECLKRVLHYLFVKCKRIEGKE